MRIKKAQGQSLKIVGLNLQSPCFSHGQLYLGCSRVGNGKNLFILAPRGKTFNIVSPEALQGLNIPIRDGESPAIEINVDAQPAGRTDDLGDNNIPLPPRGGG